MAAPAYSAIAETTDGPTEVESTDVTIPSHSSGDLLVLVVNNTGNGDRTEAENRPDTPSGWTVGPWSVTGTSSGVLTAVFYKDGNGSESSVTVDAPAGATNGTLAWSSFCLVITGAETASSVEDITGTTTGEDTTLTSPAVTTVTDETLLIYTNVFDDDTATEAGKDGDAGFNGTMRGYEEFGSPGGGHNGMNCAVATHAGPVTAGASDTCVWDNNGDTEHGIAMTIALKPAAAGGAHPVSPWGGPIVGRLGGPLG